MKKNRIHVVLDTSQSIRQEDSLVSKESLSSGLKHPSKNLSAPENSVLGVVGCSGQRQGDPCNLLINHYSPSASSRLHGRDVCVCLWVCMCHRIHQRRSKDNCRGQFFPSPVWNRGSNLGCHLGEIPLSTLSSGWSTLGHFLQLHPNLQNEVQF